MKRLWFAFLYSLSGLAAAWRDEAAFRQEVILAAVVIPWAIILAPNKLSLLLMIGSVLLVLVLELLNTAVEACINRIGPEIHPLSKKAKDTASAAVFIGLAHMLLVWSVILLF
jgi:diacylglycerol kinase (ATP)